MIYFVITFSVTADGIDVESGSTGTMSTSTDSRLPYVRQVVKEHYVNKYPAARNVDVIFTHVDEVSDEIYDIASQRFIDL